MKAQLTSVDDHISQDPDVFVSKLVIKGTRIPVERVIDQLAHNPELAELFAAYPELTLEDVKAALHYAHAALAADRLRARRPSMTATQASG